MANKKGNRFWGMAFTLSLLFLTVTFAECRSLLGQKAPKEPQCDRVVGVKSGDTCFGIAEKFKVSKEFFGFLNPNLNCTALFVGQWLCVDGTVNAPKDTHPFTWQKLIT